MIIARPGEILSVRGGLFDRARTEIFDEEIEADARSFGNRFVADYTHTTCDVREEVTSMSDDEKQPGTSEGAEKFEETRNEDRGILSDEQPDDEAAEAGDDAA